MASQSTPVSPSVGVVATRDEIESDDGCKTFNMVRQHENEDNAVTGNEVDQDDGCGSHASSDRESDDEDNEFNAWGVV